MSTIDWGQEATPQDVVVDGIATDPPGDFASRGTEDQDTALVEVVEEDPVLPPFKDQMQLITLLKVLTEVMEEAYEHHREDTRALLVDKYRAEGTKSMDVRLEDGTKVAAISLSVPKAKTEVVDEEALLKWARESAKWLIKENHVEEVPKQVIPAQPAYTEEVLDRQALADWIKSVKPVTSTGGPVVDSDTGSIVDGILYTPEGTPKTFSVRPTGDGRGEMMRRYRAGEFEHLTSGSVLPAVASADQ